MSDHNTLKTLQGGLIVSCQALAHEPLHSPFIMAKMALAAQEGGAVGIRANSVADIAAIKEAVSLPVIGLIKQDYPDSEKYITPTAKEVEALVKVGADIIAIDATARPHPCGQSLETFFTPLRRAFPNQLFMADCAAYEEALFAQDLGFDLAGTTLCGYTQNTRGQALPAFDLLARLGQALTIPLIAEGGIATPEALQKALSIPKVFAAVVGTAITRPQEITRAFVRAISPTLI